MRKLTVAFGIVVLALVVVVGVQAFGGSHHVKGQTMTGYQETSTSTPAGLYTDEPASSTRRSPTTTSRSRTS